MASIKDTTTTKDRSDSFPPLPENWTLISVPDDQTLGDTNPTEDWESIAIAKPAYAAVASHGLKSTDDHSSSDSTVTTKSCPACSFLNHTDLVSCEMCGTTFGLPGSINMPTNRSSSSAYEGQELQKECPSCTFLNHWELKQCEVCGESLASFEEQPIGEVDNKFPFPPQDDLDDIDTMVTNMQAGKRYRDVILRP